MSKLLEKIDAAYQKMLSQYVGGLSNTSTSKFDEIRSIFRKELEIDDWEDIYPVGAGTRPGNLEVRLSQGIRAMRHTVLGLAFFKAESKSHAQSLSDSAVVTVTKFLNRGKAAYDSILILADVKKEIVPTRLITLPDSSVASKLKKSFEDVAGFTVSTIPVPEKSVASQLQANYASSAIGNPEYWKIPEPPNSETFPFALQRLVEGCPGSGKSYRLEVDSRRADRVIRTVFHQESGYSDFLGNLAPETVYEIEDPAPQFSRLLPGRPTVEYAFSFGPLIEAYLLAVINPKHRVVLIVEELSRAPAALVFGDMIQLLDRVEKSEVEATMPPEGFSKYEVRPRGEIKSIIERLEAAPPHTQPGFMRFPSNLYIWATMNRADQNARQLDTAFLRRWTREHISHETSGKFDADKLAYLGKQISWGEFRGLLNSVLIKNEIREDKLIGPYFLPREAISRPERVADDLLAYVWHDVLREDGREVFPGVSTFADLRRRWAAGAQTIGSPT